MPLNLDMRVNQVREEAQKGFAVAIAALRERRFIDAEDQFLATLAEMQRLGTNPLGHEIRYAALAYFDAGCIEEGRAFFRRALEMAEPATDEGWTFHLFANSARRLELHGVQERPLKRELEFLATSSTPEFIILDQLANALKLQDKSAEAKIVSRRADRRRPGYWKGRIYIVGGLCLAYGVFRISELVVPEDWSQRGWAVLGLMLALLLCICLLIFTCSLYSFLRDPKSGHDPNM